MPPSGSSSVTHAYDVLSDPHERQQYDLGGASPASAAAAATSAVRRHLRDASSAAGGAAAQGPRSRQERGQDALVRVEVDLDEVIFGTKRDIEVNTAVLCETCKGSCCQPGTSPVTCDICHGTGQIQRTVRSLLGNVMTSNPCGTCRGYGTVIPNPCATCAGPGPRARDAAPSRSTSRPASTPACACSCPARARSARPAARTATCTSRSRCATTTSSAATATTCSRTLEVSMADAILGTNDDAQGARRRDRPRAQAGRPERRDHHGQGPRGHAACAAPDAATSSRRPGGDPDEAQPQGAGAHRAVREVAQGDRAEARAVPAGTVREAARPLPRLLGRALSGALLPRRAPRGGRGRRRPGAPSPGPRRGTP